MPRKGQKRPAIDRFDEKWVLSDTILSPNVDTPCHLWTGSLDTKGYGLFWYEGSAKRTNRWIYEYTYGPIPDGLCVLHRCDIRICTNIDHLLLGTQLENIKDRQQKNRQVKGELNGNHKLPDEQVIEIRSRPIYFGSKTALAKEFGVSTPQICNIINNKHRIL